MQIITEKSIDAALENSFIHDRKFCKYATDAVGLSGDKHKYYWSRSNHPWGSVEFEIFDSQTGISKTIVRDSETDILVVLECTVTGVRTALHIENKLSNGKFTLYQPEMYPARAKQWTGLERYGSYHNYFTVLIAPQIFYESCPEMCSKFDVYISYEDLADFIPEIATHLIQQAA